MSNYFVLRFCGKFFKKRGKGETVISGGNGSIVPAEARERLQKDEFARFLGIDLVEMRPGYARATMVVRPEFLNGAGVTHGGALFTLADLAFAAASNAHGPLALALNVNISFLKATTSGAVLTATASEESLGRKTGLYRMEVKDERGELIALANGMVYRLPDARGAGGDG